MGLQLPADVTGDVRAPDQGFFLALERRRPVSTIEWFRRHREQIEGWLGTFGVIAFRGFEISLRDFEDIADVISPDQLDYVGGMAPRTPLGRGVFNSLELAADHVAPQHQEFSYNVRWPMRILFWCDTPAALGGATTVASARTLRGRLSPAIESTFKTRRVTYVRNFCPGMPYKNYDETFGTTDRAQIAKTCEKLAVTPRWLSEDRLRLYQERPAFAVHPETGDEVFFNNAHLWSRQVFSKVPSAWRKTQELVDVNDPECLFYNTLYADTHRGIEDSVIDEILGLYEDIQMSHEWQRGDLLLIDNMLASHGRLTYQGERKVGAAFRRTHSAP